MRDKLIVPLGDADFKANGGTVGTVRYEYLERLLRQAGDLKPDEFIAGFRIDQYGIQYVIEKR